MKTFFKIIIGLVIFIATLGLIAGGAVYAYGQYGVPLVHEKIEFVETNLKEELESEHETIKSAEIQILETYYKNENGSITLAFKIYGTIEDVLGTTHEKTMYAFADIFAIILSAEEAVEIHEESEWSEISDEYETAPEIIFNEDYAKNTGIIIGSVSLGVIVLSILIRVIFLRKKRT